MMNVGSPGNLVINLAMTIQGITDSNVKITPFTVARLQELGLLNFVDINDPVEMKQALGGRCWLKESQLKNKLKLFMDLENYRGAAQFLELFCLYAAQLNPDQKIIVNKKIMKAVRAAEEIQAILEHKIKDKTLLKPHIKNLIRYTREIKATQLDAPEQQHFGKSLEKAEKILKKIYK